MDPFELLMDKMIDFSEDIFKNPELGFKEFKTAEKVKNLLESEGIKVTSQVAYTGVVATLDSGKPGANIALICELDAVPTEGHEYSSKIDNAAHTCGHYAQLGVMLGVFIHLHRQNIMKDLSGSVTLVATPSEEYCDLDYRESLKEKGIISYSSGKREMISLGIFDNTDIILSCHAMGLDMDKYDAEIGASLNGFIYKKVVFEGKAAHAGSNPSGGLNALNALTLAIAAINFQRETFKEEDAIRVHYIVNNGGLTINTVPGETSMELYIRAKDLTAMDLTNDKVDRSIRAGALAIGCDVIIKDKLGYLPLSQCSALTDEVHTHISKIFPESRIAIGTHGYASGDMGDLSMIYPTVEIGVAGFEGTLHGKDFKTQDPLRAYKQPAKYFIDTVVSLLDNSSEKAFEIKNNFEVKITKEEYLKFIEKNNKEKVYRNK
jgi:amidohydrolase